MDWFVGLFIAFGLLFFWGVWVFGYWLPMAKEHQRLFQLQEERERREAVSRTIEEPISDEPLRTRPDDTP